MPVAAMEDVSALARGLGIGDRAPSLQMLAKLLLKVDMDKKLARSYWDGSRWI
jgi:ribonuclease D